MIQRLGEDVSLARHMDQSAVTLNICLGSAFTGAEVVFEEQRDAPNNAQHTLSDKLVHAPGIVMHYQQCALF